MRKYLAPLMLLGLLAAPTAAVQAPTITVTFSCTPGGAACTEFLRLVSDALGYPGAGSRLTFVQNETLKRLHKLAREQKQLEDGNAARTSAATTFDSTYPPPE